MPRRFGVALHGSFALILFLSGCATARNPAREPILYADDGGSGGTPVVFLHSLAGSSRQWEPQLHHLRASRRAVALDWRGHGRSPASDTDFSPPAVAAEISRAVDQLGLKRFVLVGHSAGALMAIEYARQHPERVAGLMLVDPAGDSRKMPAKMLSDFLAGLESPDYEKNIGEYWSLILNGAKPDVRQLVMADLRATPKQTVIGVLRAMATYDPLTPLAEYKGPTMAVVTALNNTPISLHVLHPALPHVTVEGTSHWLQLDKPAEFNALLDRFLEQTGR